MSSNPVFMAAGVWGVPLAAIILTTYGLR